MISYTGLGMPWTGSIALRTRSGCDPYLANALHEPVDRLLVDLSGTDAPVNRRIREILDPHLRAGRRRRRRVLDEAPSWPSVGTSAAPAPELESQGAGRWPAPCFSALATVFA